MPSFTSQIPDLQNTGPVIELQVSATKSVEAVLRGEEKPVPNPIPALAMVDTGSTVTVLQEGIASQLGLKPVGAIRIHTPSSENVLCLRYPVRLLLPKSVVLEVFAIEAPLRGQPIQMLVGRDVLANAVLVYVGPMNQFTLTF